MPIATTTALIAGGIAAAGGIAGAAGSKSSSTNQSSSGINLSQASDLQNLLSGNGSGSLEDSYNQLEGMVNAGPGQQSVTNSVGATNDYANMLQQYQQNGGAPSQADINQGNQLAQNVFAPQQTQLQQSFLQQQIDANRQASMLGRSTNDPVLRAKLAQSETQQQSLLNSQQGSYAAQFAQQQPMQKLGFAQQRAGVLGGLATQAMQNRQALASLGSGLLNQQQNYQLATSGHWSNGTQQGSSGGGVGGAISGAIGGLGAGLSAGSNLASMFGNPFGGTSGSNALSLGNSQANSYFNSESVPMNSSPAQVPVFSPFTGAGSAPTPSFNGGQSRSFGFGFGG